MPWVRTRDGLAVIVVAVLIVASWAPRTAGPLDLRWDGGVYYVLGTALAQGRGYRLLNEPGEIEATQYPPLLPVLVAAHQRVVGSSDFVVVGRWLRLTYFVVHAAWVFAAYAVLRRYLPVGYALGAVVLCLVNLFTTFLSDLCFAEIPFALVTTLFVLVSGREPRRVWSVTAGVCAVAAYLLRTMGIALLAAGILEAVLKRQLKAAAVRALVVIVPVIGWHAYIARVEPSPAYTQPAYAYQRGHYMFYNVSYRRNASLRDPFNPDLGQESFEDVARRFLGNLARLPVSLGEAATAGVAYWSLFVPPWLAWGPPALVGLTVLAGVVILLAGGVLVDCPLRVDHCPRDLPHAVDGAMAALLGSPGPVRGSGRRPLPSGPGRLE